MASAKTEEFVRVLYDYEYKDSAGDRVSISKDEECILVKKATHEWWFVQRKNENKCLYVPANYVEELHKTVIQLGGKEEERKKKKGPPPKPPVKPKIKPSLEEEILKELDLILEHAADPVFENGRGEESNDKSNSSSENLSKGETLNQSSDSEPDYENNIITGPPKKSQESLRPVSNFYGTDSRKSTKDTSGNLHRKLTKSNSAGAGGEEDGNPSLESSGSQKKLNRTQYELPEYANVASLGIHAGKQPEELPDYANLAEIREAIHKRADPPKPPEGAVPVKTIDDEWDQYVDEETSRPYYFNKKTKKTEWKPPRESRGPAPPPPSSDAHHTLEGSTGGDSPTVLRRPELMRINSFGTPVTLQNPADRLTMLEKTGKRHTVAELTPGWSEDRTSGNVFFVNDVTSEKWLANKDDTGRVYFYKEDSSESSWSLPETPTSIQSSPGFFQGSRSNRNSLDPGFVASPSSGKTSPTPLRLSPSPPKRPTTLGRDSAELSSKGLVSSANTTPVSSPVVPLASPDTDTMSPDPVSPSPDPVSPSPSSAAQVPPDQHDRFQDKPQPNSLLNRSAAYRASWAAGDTRAKTKTTMPFYLSMSPSGGMRELDEEPVVCASTKDAGSLDSLDSAPKSPPTRITEKKGVLSKAKVMENGKKVKKNWSQSFVVTTGRNLYFYKDQKAAQVKPNAPHGKPEAVLDLCGAVITFGSKEKTSKKNIVQVETAGGTEYLLHHEKDPTVMHEWYQILTNNVSHLPRAPSSASLEEEEGNSPSPYGTNKKKGKKGANSLERPRTPDDGLETGEKKNKIRERLRNWLKKRPPLESLEAKGIYKYTVFGSHLLTICEREKTNVPKFVTHCISVIDERGLSTDGLYRISGNLAQIQKLRYAVDDDHYSLEEEMDIHVLTGSLKLFFRELREPLIPFKFFDKFIGAIQMQDRSQKVKFVKDLVRVLPKVNYDTMKELFAHLNRVLKHSKENRMELQNLAIVFGPTLLWPEREVTNVAVSMVYQGQIVELILQEFNRMFSH